MELLAIKQAAGTPSSWQMKSIAKAVVGTIGILGLVGPGQAFEIDTGSDVKLRWDNTIKYSLSWRVQDPSNRLLNGDPVGPGLPPFATTGTQLDDGDRNFKKGLISNRADWFTEFDATYQNVGLRVSGSAWYDDAYNRGNDNTSPGTINSTSVGAGQFTSATRTLMGRKGEILDAFIYVKNDPTSENAYTVRLGKHTVLYGESLFFGANGIAYAQAPMDMIKLLQVPGSQFKEIIRPVEQISTQFQITSDVSAGAYYQWKFHPIRIPAVGSFLSDADFVGAGSEILLPGSPIAMKYIGDLKPKDSGQFGAQLRFKSGMFDYGLYAAKYTDKGPQLLLNPAIGQYRTVYAEDVKTYGASFSTVFGETNVSGEMSVRTNAPLVSDPQVDIGPTGQFMSNGSNNPLYAVGKTGHIQASFITLFQRNAIWDGAAWLGEIAWNRTMSVDKNPLALDINTTRDAMALRTIFEPQFFQVASGLDVTVPIGLGYNPYGRSSAIFKFNGGVEHGGDFSIGLTADYQKKYKAALNYVHFFGPENAFLTTSSLPARSLYQLSNGQSLRDRDFISLSVQTTF